MIDTEKSTWGNVHNSQKLAGILYQCARLGNIHVRISLFEQ
jgi:hypothetical protein